MIFACFQKWIRQGFEMQHSPPNTSEASAHAFCLALVVCIPAPAPSAVARLSMPIQRGRGEMP